MIGSEQLQELLAFRATDSPVLSLYLNVDAGEMTRDTIKLQARSLLKQVEAKESDSTAVENYLDHQHDWSQPGLALFSCAGESFFRAYPAAVSFRNRVRRGFRPYVKPLAHLLDHYAHYGVIVVDQVNARFFEYHLGQLQASHTLVGEDIRKIKHGGGGFAGVRGEQSGAQHEDEVAARNLREAAATAGRFFEGKEIRRLFLGGTPKTVAQFREHLSRRLQSTIAGTFAIDMEAPESEVRVRALALLQAANAEREASLVENLITQSAKGGSAVTGLDDTLAAINEGRVDVLIVSDGWRAPGYVHESTGFVTANLVYSPFAQAELTAVDDVIEGAVAHTMNQGGRVEVISDKPALIAVGQIGALLRY